MAKDYTASELVNSVKRRISMPTSQQLFETADIIAFMSEEIQSTIAPEISAVQEEFFVHIQDIDMVTTQNKYTIPRRGMGNALRDVSLLDTAGQEVELPRLSLEVIKNNPARTNNRLFGFYPENNKVVIFPDTIPANNYQLRVRYKRIPSDLVTRSMAAQITAINTSLNEVTVSSTPSTWSTSTLFDFISNESPFISHADEQPVSSIVANVLTFTGSLPANLQVGDWVVEANFSPVPQIPYIGFTWLAQLGAVRSVEALTDKPGLDNAYKAEARFRNEFIKMITPRVEGSPEKINNQNGIFDWTSGFGSRRRGVW
jgi:hypothetical protein